MKTLRDMPAPKHHESKILYLTDQEEIDDENISHFDDITIS
ncbi:hypothetical protein THZB04_30561 [Vibrio owensii]|nr:hypothetical protein THZB04_30561 [Vibrio owensii]